MGLTSYVVILLGRGYFTARFPWTGAATRPFAALARAASPASGGRCAMVERACR
jgi:hypothetical protein